MLKFLSLLACVAVAVSAAEVEIDEGVLVLTSDNFEQVIKDNEFVLVEFYAPWCGHCKKLAPEFAKAAQKLAADESEVKLGKVDATVHKELGGQFGVKGYPTLKFFRDGEATDYTGGRTEPTIVNWLKKKTGPPAVKLTTVEEAEKLLEDEVAVIGFFKDMSKEAMAFLKAAGSNEEFQFGITSDDALYEKYDVEKDSVVLFKKFDDLRNDLTDGINARSINAFVSANSAPLFTEFTQQNGQKIFSNKDKPCLFLAMSKNSDEFEAASTLFTDVAKANKEKLRVVFLNTDDKSTARVTGMVGINDGEAPTYRIMNFGTSLKYKPESSDLTEEAVNDFVTKYLDGEVKPFLKSADIPEDWDASGVKVLVGKNFKEVALNPEMNVLVEFYAPWCGHCKNLIPVWDKLGEKYADSKSVIIAKMDATENEVEEVSIRGFPTIKFFPAVEFTKAVDYNGGRSFEDFVKYIEDAVPEEAEEEEEEQANEEEEEEKEEEKEEKKEEKKEKKKSDKKKKKDEL